MDEKQIIETESVGHIVTADELTIDEGAIIREQERLANEKKKKIAAKRTKVILIILAVILAVGIWYLGWGRKLLNTETETTVDIVATQNQEVTFVRINKIYGNEIDYTVLEKKEQEVTEDNSTDTNSGNTNFGNTNSEGQGRPSKNETDNSGTSADTTNEVPDMSGFSGFGGSEAGPPSTGGSEANVPSTGDSETGAPSADSTPSTGSNSSRGDKGNFGGGNSSKGDRGNGSGMPSGFSGSFGGNGSGSTNGRGTSGAALSYNGDTYILTDETEVTLIPVGVVVTTKLGTETTFSRISTGDCLAIVTEVIDGEETIIAIYIVG